MRCPKCHYVSFEPEPRCRHCGYGFSLAGADRAAAPADDGDRNVGVAGPPASTDPAARRAAQPAEVAHGRPRPVGVARTADLLDAPQPVRARSGSALADPHPNTPVGPDSYWEPELVRTPAATTAELPLFVRAVNAVAASEEAAAEHGGQDAPLVRVPVEPRSPLAVRRPAPDTDAHRAAPSASVTRTASRRLGPLDRDLLEDLQRIEQAERAGSAVDGSVAGRVGAVPRLAAAAFDAVIIGGLSAAVLWVTLRWLDLPFEQVTTLPFAPMTAFLAVVGFGYLLMFTAAGGQTIGKMVFGLRVVRERDEDAAIEAVTLSQAAYRVMLSLPSVLALGAGFLPALVGDRTVHDRLAHTRVVRA